MTDQPGIEKIEKKITDKRAGNGGARSGAGRKKRGERGPGKVSYDLKAAAQAFTPTALGVLVSILEDEDATNADKIKAAQAVMDRSHGRPVQAIEGTGENGEIVVTFRR